MVTDTQNDLITELARYVEPWTPERVTAAVAALTEDQVKVLYARIRPINKRDAAIQAAAKKRLEGLMKVGDKWADPDTKAAFEWAAGKSDDWKVDDVRGFREAMMHVKRDHECATTSVTCVRPSCRCACPGCGAAPGSFLPVEIDMMFPPTYDVNNTFLNKVEKSNERAAEVMADYRKKPPTKPDLREVTA